ncbi:MAG: adenylate/guanylate cyclase domain-containing protein [Acidobacteria bacterium]|nr:adenylate/guanylate cyclase domain-containing protein [Acidobacteriota bacterium]
MSSDMTHRRGLLARAGGTSVATRLAAAVIVLAMFSFLIATFVGIYTGNRLGEDITDDQLRAMQASSALEIQGSVTGLLRATTASATSPMATDAIAEFKAAHDQLGSIPLDELQDEAEQVLESLREQYLEPLGGEDNPELGWRDLISPDPASLYLQFHYAALAAREGIDPASVDDPLDGSEWSKVHQTFHPSYRDLVEQQGLSDLLLVEPTNATVVYSVAKRPDFGTSLRTGPFSGSAVASVVEEVLADPEAGVRMSDLSFYDPALLAPVGVIAAPVIAEGQLNGVMVFEYPIERFGSLLTADLDWDGAGIPDTAQTYMFGSDDRMRSIDRSFVEDPDGYLETLQNAGTLSVEEVATIVAAETTALTVSADKTSLAASRDGDQSTISGSNIGGHDAIRSVVKLDLDDVDWWIVSEIQTDGARRRLDTFTKNLVGGAALFIVAVSFAAVFWARRLLRPVRAISDQLVDDNFVESLEIDLPKRSPVEFRKLAERFEEMSDNLNGQQRAISEVRAERLLLLREVLPDSLAEHIDAVGYEADTLVAEATVSVLTVTGLSDLVRSEVETASRSLIETLHAALDEIATEHGVERIKVVGDAYFAACGQGQPYLDHAPRCVRFALDAREAIVEMGATHGFALDLAAGIDTGPVTVGMAGGSRLLYDIWGITANNAHLLARGGRSGEIRISDEVRRRLPAGYLTADGPSDPAGEPTWIVQGSAVGSEQ